MSSDKKDNTSNPMTEKNLAAAHAVDNAFATGNTGALDSVIADNFVDHTDRGDKMGRDSLKAMIMWMRSDSKDMKMETIKELADNDYVMSYNRYSGTSSGGMGKPGHYDMQAVEVVKFKDGKAVEHWGFMSMTDVMKMMPAPKMDEKMKSK